MSEPIKVYNKGIRPVVFKRNRSSVEALHPRRFKLFDPKRAKEIIDKFDDACSEEDYEKHLKEVAKKQEEDQKEAENKAEKKTKNKS